MTQRVLSTEGKLVLQCCRFQDAKGTGYALAELAENAHDALIFLSPASVFAWRVLMPQAVILLYLAYFDAQEIHGMVT